MSSLTIIKSCISYNNTNDCLGIISNAVFELDTAVTNTFHFVDVDFNV